MWLLENLKKKKKIFDNVWSIYELSQVEGEVPLTPSGWRPRMLLNVPQYYRSPNANNGEVGNSVLFYETKTAVIFPVLYK